MGLAMEMKKQSQTLRQWLKLIHCYELIGKAFEHYQAHSHKVHLSRRKHRTAQRVARMWRNAVGRRALTLEARALRTLRNCLTVFATTTVQDGAEERALALFCAFSQKANQTMQFKQWAEDFRRKNLTI